MIVRKPHNPDDAIASISGNNIIVWLHGNLITNGGIKILRRTMLVG